MEDKRVQKKNVTRFARSLPAILTLL